MCLLAALDSQGIVVKCTAAIFFRTVDSVVIISCHRRTGNLEDLDDGYQAVGAPSAARQLQASRQVADVTYAQVDMSQKTSRQQVADVYAQVDNSKKPKKKQRKV